MTQPRPSFHKHTSFCLGRIFLFQTLRSLPKRSTTSTRLHLLSENSGNVFTGILQSKICAQFGSICCQFFSECHFHIVFFDQLVKVRQRQSRVLALRKPWSLTPPVRAKKPASGIVVIVATLWTVQKKNASRATELPGSSRVRRRWTLPTLNPDCRTPACPAWPTKNTRSILTFCRAENHQGLFHRYRYFFSLMLLF